MTLQQLRYLVAIGRTASFRLAAKQLSVSQPTISQQLAALERELGVTLVERRRGRATITEIGQRVMHLADLMLANEAAIIVESQQFRHLTSLRVGCIRGALELLAGPGLTSFRQQHGAVRLSIHEGGSLELIEQMARGELDFALVADNGSLPTAFKTRRQEVLSSELLFCEPLTYLHPRLTEETRPMIVLREGYLLNQVMLRFVEHHPSQTLIHATSVESAAALVADGFGATILPRYVIERSSPAFARSVLITPLEQEVPDLWRWMLIWEYDRSLSQVDRAFIASVLASRAKNSETSSGDSMPTPVYDS